MKKHSILVAEHEDGKLRAHIPELAVNKYGSSGQKIRKNDSPEETLAPLNPDIEDVNSWEPWGDRDNLPTLIRQGIENVPIASTAVQTLTRMMYGNGIVYYTLDDLHDGDNKVTRAYIPEVEDFLDRNRINTEWLPSVIVNYRYMQNAFSEIVFNKLRNKVMSIYAKNNEFCRLERQNKTSLRVENLLYHPDFANPYGVSQKEAIQKIKMYQWDEPDFLKNFRGNKLAIHSRFPSPGITYYARPWWIGLFKEDGWIDVAKEIPKIIRAIHKNQISIKYQILIPESYFEIRYAWGTFTQEEKNEKFKDLEDTITNNLVGSDNSYKTLISYFGQDSYGKDSGKVEIKAIDDKLKDGAWVPDSEKADQQIVMGLGLHPSQAGLQPEGGKMGAGSGSDQRESYNTAITLNQLDKNIILEPLNLIARINGWGIKFAIDHVWHVTTDQDKRGIQEGDTTLVIDK